MTQQYNTDLPSGRIRYALASLAEFEQEEGCEVTMYTFFRGRERKCNACFGGAAALYYGKIPKKEWFNPKCRYSGITNNFGQELFGFADSLNDARNGRIGFMFEQMGLPLSEGFDFERIMPEYHDKPDEFKSEIQRLADDLEAAGY